MSEEKMMTREEWAAEFDKTQARSDINDREAKIARISSDPAPKWREEPAREYPTTEKHYIICIDKDKANASLPDAEKIYGIPHEFGAFLISDRAQLPEGWIKAPLRGTPLTAIQTEHPELYSFLKAKNVERF